MAAALPRDQRGGRQRTHDGLGRPLTPVDQEFFRIREEEGYTGPLKFDYDDQGKPGMPYKVDDQGNRTG
jgi:hypothetical protein